MSELSSGRGSSAVNGLSLVGAVSYFLQYATTFSEGLFGIVKGYSLASTTNIQAVRAFKNLESFLLI